jgi:hypothetical protein
MITVCMPLPQTLFTVVASTDLERYAALPDLVRVIVAHEKVARGADASAALRQAATYL